MSELLNDPSDRSSVDWKVQADRRRLLEAGRRGGWSRLRAYVRLSGPGWLQSAITLGGNSLVSSLYLGVLGGVAMLWLQPLAMGLGVVMLGAISYVTLSTGRRPLEAINRYVNPVLGWGWVLATLVANVVWCLPQFTLGTAAIQQNLFAGATGPEGTWLSSGALLLLSLAVVWSYGSRGWGVRLFETVLKAMIGLIVLSFFGVVVKMSMQGLIDWGRLGAGLVPDLGLLSRPAATLEPYLAAVEPKFQPFWRQLIVGQQRDVMITAAATAVGINMTFLLPYSMLRKGWDRAFRGLAVFDLVVGLFVPYVLATGCVVIASASQFHARPAPGFLGERDARGRLVQPADNLVAGFNRLVDRRLAAEYAGYDAMPEAQRRRLADRLPHADRQLAAMLVKRDPKNFAQSLAPLIGPAVAHKVFGLGVTAMAVSTIIILMLISGLVICEMLGVEPTGMAFRLACLPAALGVLGPVVWRGEAKIWLSVPTSVFCMALLPVAYISFFLLFNQKRLMGPDRPVGLKLWAWNGLMALAIGLTGLGSFWSIWSKTRWYGVAAVSAYVGLAVVVHLAGRRRRRYCGERPGG